MFVCKQEIADDYFNWCFKILKKLCEKTQMVDNKEYRVLGYISEILLDVYVKKNKLKFHTLMPKKPKQRFGSRNLLISFACFASLAAVTAPNPGIFNA